MASDHKPRPYRLALVDYDYHTFDDHFVGIEAVRITRSDGFVLHDGDVDSYAYQEPEFSHPRDAGQTYLIEHNGVDEQLLRDLKVACVNWFGVLELQEFNEDTGLYSSDTGTYSTPQVLYPSGEQWRRLARIDFPELTSANCEFVFTNEEHSAQSYGTLWRIPSPMSAAEVDQVARTKTELIEMFGGEWFFSGNRAMSRDLDLLIEFNPFGGVEDLYVAEEAQFRFGGWQRVEQISLLRSGPGHGWELECNYPSGNPVIGGVVESLCVPVKDSAVVIRAFDQGLHEVRDYGATPESPTPRFAKITPFEYALQPLDAGSHYPRIGL